MDYIRGMNQLPITMEQIAKKNGVVFHYNFEIKKIELK